MGKGDRLVVAKASMLPDIMRFSVAGGEIWANFRAYDLRGQPFVEIEYRPNNGQVFAEADLFAVHRAMCVVQTIAAAVETGTPIVFPAPERVEVSF